MGRWPPTNAPSAEGCNVFSNFDLIALWAAGITQLGNHSFSNVVTLTSQTLCQRTANVNGYFYGRILYHFSVKKVEQSEYLHVCGNGDQTLASVLLCQSRTGDTLKHNLPFWEISTPVIKNRFFYNIK